MNTGRTNNGRREESVRDENKIKHRLRLPKWTGTCCTVLMSAESHLGLTAQLPQRPSIFLWSLDELKHGDWLRHVGEVLNIILLKFIFKAPLFQKRLKILLIPVFGNKWWCHDLSVFVVAQHDIIQKRVILSNRTCKHTFLLDYCKSHTSLRHWLTSGLRGAALLPTLDYNCCIHLVRCVYVTTKATESTNPSWQTVLQYFNLCWVRKLLKLHIYNKPSHLKIMQIMAVLCSIQHNFLPAEAQFLCINVVSALTHHSCSRRQCSIFLCTALAEPDLWPWIQWKQ